MFADGGKFEPARKKPCAGEIKNLVSVFSIATKYVRIVATYKTTVVTGLEH
jgi:hypothetical protein